ncbi:hypothetical protein ABTM85_20645, partial [Acinetobacter baumannii]
RTLHVWVINRFELLSARLLLVGRGVLQHGRGAVKQLLQQMASALVLVWRALPKWCQTHTPVQGLMNEE